MNPPTPSPRNSGITDGLRRVLTDGRIANLTELCRCVAADPRTVRTELERLVQRNLVERIRPISGERPDWVYYRWQQPSKTDFTWQRDLFCTDVHIRKESAFRELSMQW